MKENITIYLVDDHQMVRDGIRAMLQSEQNIQIIGESDGRNDVISSIKQCNPDIVLMDVSLGDVSGLDLTIEIIKNEHSIKIIILSMFSNSESIFKAIDCGIHGYLSKNAGKDEIITAILTVARGETFYNNEITSIMLKSMIASRQKEVDKNTRPCIECLTPREIETLKLFSEGLTNQEISERLNISIRTAESHKTHIMQKLGFKSQVDMVKFAIRNKIADIE